MTIRTDAGTRARVRVLQQIGKAIRSMEDPAVEKIAEDTQDDPFQVLIATFAA